jgi:hypothetical protein
LTPSPIAPKASIVALRTSEFPSCKLRESVGTADIAFGPKQANFLAAPIRTSAFGLESASINSGKVFDNVGYGWLDHSTAFSVGVICCTLLEQLAIKIN